MAFSGLGAGTINNPYQITSIAQLQEMQDELSAHYKIMNDIDASATATWNESVYTAGHYYGFYPIGGGNDWIPFTGTLDGNDKKITGLFIDRSTYEKTGGGDETPESSRRVGLFGAIENDGENITIKDLELEDVHFTGDSTVGGFVAEAYKFTQDVFFENCRVSGMVISKQDMAGGFVAQSYQAQFDNCHSTASVSSAIDTSLAWHGKAGGFVGDSNGSVYENCSATGVVFGTTEIGGFAGLDTLGSSVFRECFAKGNVTATLQGTVGGFVGHQQNEAVFDKCYATGNVINTATTGTIYAGGFFGSLDFQCEITNCFATGNIDVYLARSVGGFVGRIADTGGMVIDSCYATGSINTETTILFAGGFVGEADGSGATAVSITNAYARGDVCKDGTDTTTARLGGFIGGADFFVDFENCYSVGYVFPTSNAGGFAGNGTHDQVTFAGCYWDTETSGRASSFGGAGVIGKPTAELKFSYTFAGWDFASVWAMSELGRAFGNLTVWLSRSGDYDRFDTGVKDNDSFELMVPTANGIRWLGALESLLLGTAGDEWLIGSNKLETPLSPTNFKIKQQSEYGSSRIQPIKINSSLMFVDFVARKIREMTFVDPKYESPDLTALAEHITLHGITTIARQKNPDSIIWCTLGDGSLISMTYEREQDVVAWAKHPIDGFVQSVAVLPGATEDTVYLSVERTINGADKVYLEKLASRVFETKADCHFADCGITVSVDDSDEITGLEHLAGEKVAVLAGGVVIYDGTEDESVVSELGVLTLPETITAAKVHIGIPYPSKLRPMRIIVGDSMGSHVRVAELVISLYNTGALKYGVNENNLIDVDLNDVRWNNTCKIKGLFTGEVVVSVPGGFDPLVPIFIVNDAPLPLTVRAIVPRIERTGR